MCVAFAEGEYVAKGGAKQRHGKGMFTDGVETYTGEWKDDAMHGNGASTTRAQAPRLCPVALPLTWWSCGCCLSTGKFVFGSGAVYTVRGVWNLVLPGNSLMFVRMCGCLPLAGFVCRERVRGAGKV